MSYGAPFTIQEASEERCGPRLFFCLVIIMALVPIVVFGAVLEQWTFTLLWAVLVACAVLWICLRSLLSIRFVQRLPFVAEPVMRLLMLVVGIIVLMSPVALYAGMYPGSMKNINQGSWLVSFSSAFYSAIQAVSLSMSPGDWISDTRALGVLSEVLLSAHAFLILFYAIACPLATVFAALDAIFNGISDTRIKFWSWRKAHGSTPGEIYVFHELDTHGATLAHSIINTRNEQPPLIVFANVGDLEAQRDETLMEDLVDRAKGKASVIFTSLPAEAIPGKLSQRALETCGIRYFAISKNGSSNLMTTGLVWDTIFDQLWNKTWDIWNSQYAKQSRNLNPSDYADLCRAIATAIDNRAIGERDNSETSRATRAIPSLDPAAFDPILRMGDRLGIHCLYTHSMDGALLDSLLTRNVQSIENRLTEACQEHHDEIMDGVRELATRLRNLVEMHLLSQPELAVQRLFDQHPLYEVLDSIDLSRECANDRPQNQQLAPTLAEQQLTVLILGFDDYGIEALRAVFWLGRLARTQLKIVVVDKSDVREKMEHLFLACPEIMTERTYSENPNGPRRGMWSISKRHDTPTVRFCETDVFGTEMRALLKGQKVHAMWYTADKNPTIAEGCEPLLTEDDHLYCLVCLDDDNMGLDAALDLQRCLAERKLHTWRENDADAPVAGRRSNVVPIAVRLRGEYVLTTGKLGDDGLQSGLWDLGFPLYSFGSVASTFTYDSIENDAIKDQAIQITALSEMSFGNPTSLRKSEMDYEGLRELDKFHHRSTALSIPYKLWMLGLDAGEVSTEEFRRRLGVAAGDQAFDVTKKTFNAAEDREFRSQWPLFSYMADLEHIRWCALRRSLGWRDMTAFLESDSSGSNKGRLEDVRMRLPLEGGTHSLDLKIHYFLCDDIEELSRREEDCDAHPLAYTRMLLWHIVDILHCAVCR